jgi:predicted ribosome quality control (RQC) complex YloA/Tae2 family protein
VHAAGGGAPRLSPLVPDDDTLARAGLAGSRIERHASLADAGAAWGEARRAHDARSRLLAAVRAHWHAAARRARRALDAIERDLAHADRSAEFRRTGEALVASFALLRRGASEARVPDPHDASTTLVIPLDPTKTPQENADRYFKDARRGERGRATMLARRETVSRDLARAEEEFARWSDASAESAAQEELVAAARTIGLLQDSARSKRSERGRTGESSGRWRESEILPTRSERSERASARWRATGPAGRRPSRDHDPFFGARLFRYSVSGNFTVLVGRTDADNDLLTHKIARPWDLWFHSGQSAGSHVVLVKGSAKAVPPKEALLEAAALAAHHSKARHAGLVPVIFTERRFVRRPRGAPPGTVTCEREKTLFVRPDPLEAKRLRGSAEPEA